MNTIFNNNDVGHDTNGSRSLRLLAIKTYIQALVDWALAAYDAWIAALGNSTVEMGESEEAYSNMQEADKTTFNYYLKCKGLLMDIYGTSDKTLKIYGIKGQFPQARKDKLRAVQNLLDANKILTKDANPNVLPVEFIGRLEGYLSASNNAFSKFVLKEKPEALAAVDTQNNLKIADTKQLRILYSWTQMTWSPYEPFLIQLGFAPATPKASGGQPDIPLNLSPQWQYPRLTWSWDICENATSYQLAISENSDDWEELYFGAETSFSFDPPTGKRYYKIRARNANGFSEWSTILEFEPSDVPE
ncbi:MAG: discoidin domain-containing protein [Candidatus Cloacimonetes bacterium]|nr:discoidin domain-containing protein [Candidatus Cloacimonadota bacterium]